MGRAILTENLTEGQYKIEHRYSRETITARQKTIDQALADADWQVIETQAKLDAALLHMRVINDALNGVLSSTTLTPAEKDKQARDIVTQQQAQRLVVLGFQSTLGSLAATRTSLQLEYLRLGKVPLTTKRTVWSADYSPDLGIAGIEVGTIEVPGEEQEVLLYPAKNQFRPWTPAIDGDLTPVAAQSPMAWLYNTCLVTGWQKYRPTYRFAKVLKILDADHMEVEIIDPLKSTYGDVDITPTLADLTKPLYTTVVCEYLDCNAAAFTAGDEVVVQYVEQNPDKPKVIGFRTHPRPCAGLKFFTPREQLTIPAETWTRLARTGQLYGNAYWSGAAGALSWMGWSSRYRLDLRFEATPSLNPPASPLVCSAGKVLATAPGRVRGACLTVDPAPNGAKWLIVVCCDWDFQQLGSSVEYVYALNLDVPTSAWLTLHTETYATAFDDYPVIFDNPMTTTAWFFNKSGTQGITVKPLGGWPSGSFDRTRLVQVDIAFASGVPTATLVYPAIRHPEHADSYSLTDGLAGLGIFGTNGSKHEVGGESWRWFDVIADYVDDTLYTLDRVAMGESTQDIVCGNLSTLYRPSGMVSAVSVVETRVGVEDHFLVNEALDLSVRVHRDDNSDTTTYAISLWSSYTDPTTGFTTQFPEYTISQVQTQVLSNQVLEWMDYTGGLGKVLRVQREEVRTHTTSVVRHEQYTYDPTDGSVDQVTVSSPTVTVDTGTCTTRLQAGSTLTFLGEASGDFDDPLTDALWACADRRGHGLVALKKFNVKRGHPPIPADVLASFEPVGLG